MKKSILCSLIVFLGCIYEAQAQTPKFVNEFLNIGVGARSHGMFGSMSAHVDDITAGYWNPAGLARIDKKAQAVAMHANWFGGISNYDYISYGKQLDPDKKSFGSLSFIRLGVDNIPNTLNLIGPDGSINYDQVTSFSAADYALFASYAQALGGSSSPFTIGGSVKVIRRTIGSFGGSWGFGADLGIQYRSDRFALGVMARDVTSTFNAWSFNLDDNEKAQFLATGNDVPVNSTEIALPRIVLGGAYFGGSDKFSYTIEADLNISTDGRESGVVGGNNFNVDPTVGVELGISKKVYVRAGIGNIQRIINEVNGSQADLEYQPNIGMGVVLGRVRVDYALANVNESAGLLKSHIFSVHLDFVDK